MPGMEAPRHSSEMAAHTCTTPISHSAHILIMGPGGYHFLLDDVTVGGLPTLVTPSLPRGQILKIHYSEYENRFRENVQPGLALMKSFKTE
jgi:hypothetical protein